MPDIFRKPAVLQAVDANHLGMAHAVSTDLVGKHQVANTQGDDTDKYPQKDVADDAGQVNGADQAANPLSLLVVGIGFADNKALHVVRKYKKRQTQCDDCQQNPNDDMANNLHETKLGLQLIVIKRSAHVYA